MRPNEIKFRGKDTLYVLFISSPSNDITPLASNREQFHHFQHEKITFSGNDASGKIRVRSFNSQLKLIVVYGDYK